MLSLQDESPATEPAPLAPATVDVYRATVLDATIGRRWHAVLSFRPIAPGECRRASGALATWTDGAAEPAFRLATPPGDWGVGRDGRLRDRDKPSRRLRAGEALALAVSGVDGFMLQAIDDAPPIADDFSF